MLVARLVDIFAVVTVATDTPVLRLRDLQVYLLNFNFMPTGIEIIQRSQLSQRR